MSWACERRHQIQNSDTIMHFLFYFHINTPTFPFYSRILIYSLFKLSTKSNQVHPFSQIRFVSIFQVISFSHIVFEPTKKGRKWEMFNWWDGRSSSIMFATIRRKELVQDIIQNNFIDPSTQLDDPSQKLRTWSVQIPNMLFTQTSSQVYSYIWVYVSPNTNGRSTHLRQKLNGYSSYELEWKFRFKLVKSTFTHKIIRIG